jgi:16S rRNA G966 N2-methylase RsmD
MSSASRSNGPAAAFDVILADPPYAKAPGERDFASE